MATHNAGKKKVVFSCKANPGDEVFIAGSFNDWEPASIQLVDEKGDGNFQKTLFLSKGRHEYKFIINGVWTLDTSCPEWTSNGMGSLNSVIEVQ
jgi:1,4-alpha-glucan branching enzyme